MVGLDLGMRGGGSIPTVSYMGSGEEDTLFSALVPGKGAPPGDLVNFFSRRRRTRLGKVY